MNGMMTKENRRNGATARSIDKYYKVVKSDISGYTLMET